MQLSLNAYKPIPKDDTLDEYIQKSAQLSVLLDGIRYVLVRRLGRVFNRTNKDIIIDLLDAWLEHNIEMFPADEQETIKNIIIDRKAGNNISNRKPQ